MHIAYTEEYIDLYFFAVHFHSFWRTKCKIKIISALKFEG